MMKWFRVQDNLDGTVWWDAAPDDAISPVNEYDPILFSWEEWTGEPTERDSATIELDEIGAEEWTLDQLEKIANKKTLEDVKCRRRQLAMMEAWREVQDLKLCQQLSAIPPDATDKVKRWPILMALAQETGNTLAVIATAVENRLWDRVRRFSLREAKMLTARDDVRSLVTKDEKIGVIDSVSWDD